ncbi:MAG: glycoside hydrolase, partial [Bacteroidales bacterium]|nr:glycoside hydrolase [Bacteroidales bacterium]
THLQTREHKGRIVVPCNNGEYENWTVCHVIYSDDGGETWNIGGNAGSGNECTVTELANGDIMLNMRGQGSDNGLRRVAVSHDGGLTFDEPYHDEGLEEPVCNASIINYAPDGVPTETLLFSNPPSKVEREHMTIKRSDDSGRTWKVAYKLSDKPGAYSDLLVLPNGDVAILYETGEEDAYERIDFALIPAKHFTRK